MVVRRKCETRPGNIQGVGRSGVEYSRRLEAGSGTERRGTIRSLVSAGAGRVEGMAGDGVARRG